MRRQRRCRLATHGDGHQRKSFGGGCGPGLVCTNTKCIHFCDTAAPVCATGMCVAITTPEFRQGPRTYGLCYERP